MRRPLLAAIMLITSTAAFAAPAKPHEAWGSGTIEKVDSSARSLVVKQGTHEMTFAVAQTAQVLEGKSTRTLADLSKDVGQPVKVRYTTANGTRTADRVQVAAHASTPHAPK